MIQEASSFFAARIWTLLICMGTMCLLITVMGMSNKKAKLIVRVIVMVSSCVFSKMLVFR